FLHHMVRNIAGVLLPIGQGKRDAEWIHEVMEARDRRASGITAPAGGLYLVGVDYDPGFGLPRAPVQDIVPLTP
ncbi:MAG: tRNA pseudouridine(38-40) synthase TruA, partial [Thioalkalivibrio sp.]|nr:tRNA pseudouridine(38-40) synthase TruA [Thioalkalivibrio sp.]